MEITEELKAKAFACESVEQLLALAADNDIELCPEEAELILGIRAESEGELADVELENVAGGQAGCKRNAHEMVYFNSEAEVEFLFNIGDIKQAFIGVAIGNETCTVRITQRGTTHSLGGWHDSYKFDRISGAPTHWGFGWSDRNRFEK